MTNFFQRLFGSKEPAPAEDTAALEREIQSLRLDLKARDEQLAHLKQEVERLRSRQEQLVNETTEMRLEALFNDLAAPAAQMITQAELLENQNKPVQPRDLAAVGRRLVRALERHGLRMEGQVGQQTEFDPNRHQAMNAETSPQLGQPVTIRFVGMAYRGKIIYKALVEEASALE